MSDNLFVVSHHKEMKVGKTCVSVTPWNKTNEVQLQSLLSLDLLEELRSLGEVINCCSVFLPPHSDPVLRSVFGCHLWLKEVKTNSPFGSRSLFSLLWLPVTPFADLTIIKGTTQQGVNCYINEMRLPLPHDLQIWSKHGRGSWLHSKHSSAHTLLF